MLVEIPEKKIRRHPTQPNAYILYKANKVTVDNEAKKIEAFIINKDCLNDLVSYLETASIGRSLSFNKYANFKPTVKEDTLSIEFTGDLIHAALFLRQYEAISRDTETKIVNQLNDCQKVSSATTVLSSTPSL